MITFNDLKSQVYEIAQQRFGHLTDDIKQRLDVELAAIEKYDNSAVIACIWRLFDELYKNNICSQLRIFNEYGVSLVCYVLGISMFNPLDHPTLDAESIALKAFRYCPWFNFSIDGNAYKLIEQWLKEWGYEFEIEATDNISSMIMSLRINANKIIRFDIRCRPSSCKLRQAILELGDKLFYNIPFDDKDTFEAICNLDLYGTTTACFSPITLDALRLIKPSSLNELAMVLSFAKEDQYEDLMNYTSDRGVNRSNNFAQYVEAFNIYKLSYIKTHYPDHFNKILTHK